MPREHRIHGAGAQCVLWEFTAGAPDSDAKAQVHLVAHRHRDRHLPRSPHHSDQLGDRHCDQRVHYGEQLSMEASREKKRAEQKKQNPT